MAYSHDLFMECFDKTEHFSKYWKELGTRLRLEPYLLDDIESNHPRNVVRCRMNMLSTWLKSDPADPTAELDAALDDLQRTVHDTGVHEQKVTLDQDIQTRISNLKTEFGHIVVLALRWLEHHYPEPRDAVRWLNEILRGLQSERLVLPSSSVADNVPLDEQLQSRWSFTNPAILEGLVQKTNDKDLIERMKKYNEDFKYVRRSIPISDQKIVLERFHRDKPCLIVIFQNITYFDDIELFLREVFDIYRRYLRVHKIEPGCVKVTLQFDASMESFLEACIDQKREAVKHYAEMEIVPLSDYKEKPVTVLKYHSISGLFIPLQKEVTSEFEHIIRSHKPVKNTGKERSHSFSGSHLKIYPTTKPRKRANSTECVVL